MKRSFFTFLFAGVLVFSAHSQTKKPAAAAPKETFAFFTVMNGVKTKVNPTEQITIHVDRNGKYDKNVVIEFYVQELHKKYPYDLIAVELFNETKKRNYSNLGKMNFVDAGTAKTLQNTPTKIFTLYPEFEGTYKKDEGLFLDFTGISTKYNGDSLAFSIGGAYSNGTETYYDDYSKSVKTRNTFSKYTQISEGPYVHFEFDPDMLLEDVSSSLVKGLEDNYRESFQYNGNTYLSMLAVKKEFEKTTDQEATKAFIGAYFKEHITQMTNNLTTSTQFVKDWVKFVEESSFLNLSNLTPEEKKTIDKVIRKNKGMPVDELAALIKATNTNPQVYRLDYSKAYEK